MIHKLAGKHTGVWGRAPYKINQYLINCIYIINQENPLQNL
jgi:hypothetical protein